MSEKESLKKHKKRKKEKKIETEQKTQLLLITLASLHGVEIDHNIWFEAPLNAWKHAIGRLSNPLQLSFGSMHLYYKPSNFLLHCKLVVVSFYKYSCINVTILYYLIAFSN